MEANKVSAREGQIVLTGPAGTDLIQVGQPTDSTPRWKVDSNGVHYRGNGSGAVMPWGQPGLTLPPPVGKYLIPQGTTNIGSAQPNGTLRVAPFVVPMRMGFNAWRMQVATASTDGSPTLTACLYYDSGQFYPGALFPTNSVFAVTSTGAKENAVTEFFLDPGLYWIGGLQLGQPASVASIRTYQGWQGGINDGDLTTLNTHGTYEVASLSALPGDFPPFSGGTVTMNDKAPKIALKRST